MKVTVLGANGIGLRLAEKISEEKGYSVTIYALKSEAVNENLEAFDKNTLKLAPDKIKVTYNMADAVYEADVILCTVPARLRERVCKETAEYIKPGVCFGFIPGCGGAEFFCHNLLERGVNIFSAQNVPNIICGHEVVSDNDALYIGSVSNANCDDIAGMMEKMLSVKCKALPDYLTSDVLLNDKIFYIIGSYVYLKKYDGADVFLNDAQPWNDECSRIFDEMKNEVLKICRKYPIGTHNTELIQNNFKQLTAVKLSSQPLIMLPVIKTYSGYIPDFLSPCYVDVVQYCICTLKALAVIADVETPVIDEILSWYHRMTGREFFKPDNSLGKDISETAIPQRFKLNKYEDVCKFYFNDKINEK